MRLLYDGITASNLPPDAVIVAGYVDGLFRWKDSDWARFTRAIKVRIAAFASTQDGQVLDVEAGDATPAQAPAWVLARRVKGVDPTIYTSYGNLGHTWGVSD